MLHVGALHQTSEVEAVPGRGAEVGGGLGGEVGVDERGEIGLVAKQSRPGGGGAAPQRVDLFLRRSVAAEGGAEALRLQGSAHTVPALTRLPAATAAAPSEPEES